MASTVIVLIAVSAILTYRRVRVFVGDACCDENVGLLAMSAVMYASDCDDTYPPGAHWLDSVEPYRFTDSRPDRREEQRPVLAESNPNAYGYAFNRACTGRKCSTKADAPRVPPVFESMLTGRNAVGGLDTIPRTGCHDGKSYAGCGDSDAADQVADGKRQ